MIALHPSASERYREERPGSMERLVGNAHPPVTYPVKTGTDQCHRDEPRKGSETPRSTEAVHP